MGHEKRGRDPMFKCSICGRFVSYDRRTVNWENGVDWVYDGYLEFSIPEDIVIFTHKKCEKKK